ncbi:MAG: hypothetical protein Q4C70_08405 [Planctomycetia bacterium]|nr:hypothetical protein [Planctomycetia bacterium]
MQRCHFWVNHVIAIFFPVIAILGGYGLWIFVSAYTDTGATRPDSESVQTPFSPEDPFYQLARFSEADLQDEIATYEFSLPTVSPRFGASVSVKVAMSGNAGNSGRAGNSGNVEGVGTGKDTVSILDSAAVADGTNSALTPPPTMNVTSSDIWRIETAYASRQNPSPSQVRKLAFYRWVNETWMKQDAEAFFGSVIPAQPIIFYVHGNRTELNTATMQGLKVLKNYPAEIAPRLVLWSWDADRVSRRPKIEFPTKARYADYQGFYLAEILGTLTPENHVLLAGHSFGARTILSALHLLAGGAYGTRTLDSAFPQESFLTEVSWKSQPNMKNNVKHGIKTGTGVKMEAVSGISSGAETEAVTYTLPSIDVFLVAAAVDCNVMNSGALYDRALEPVSHLTLTRNASDPALKFYPVMYGSRNRAPDALGYVGPVMNHVEPELKSKVRVIRVDSRTHQFLEYMDMRSVQNGLLF